MEEGMKKRRYDKEFKINAIRLVNEGGRTVKEVSMDLGIEANLLHTWKRRYKEEGSTAFVGKGHLPAAEEEKRKMLKRLRDVEEERDILKKALAIFSRQAGRNMVL